ncbi:hypothetical protein NL676_027471 [Syzygium grande]|nr:hypothetical protein NL676_027471 [Syzygium grande]
MLHQEHPMTLCKMTGQTAIGGPCGNPFLGKQMSTQKAHSRATAETYSISRANVYPEGLFDGNCRWVDAEVRELVDRAYSRSKQIITTHFDILHKLAQIVKEEETVDRKQFTSLSIYIKAKAVCRVILFM